MGEWPSQDAWARAGAGDRGVCLPTRGSRERRQGWRLGRTFQDMLLWWLILTVNLTAFRRIVRHVGWRWVCFKKNFSYGGETSPWRWATLSMCWSPELNRKGKWASWLWIQCVTSHSFCREFSTTTDCLIRLWAKTNYIFPVAPLLLLGPRS